MSKAPDPLCSQKVWRKITLVKFKGNLRVIKGDLRKIKGKLREFKGSLRKTKGKLRKIKGNFLEQKRPGAFDNQGLEMPEKRVQTPCATSGESN